MIAALLNHLWQSTLFCGGAWLITLILRENSAALRHTIWLVASLKFLVPFSLLFYLGSFIGLPAARTAAGQPLILGDALQSATALVSPAALPSDRSGRRLTHAWRCSRFGWWEHSSSCGAGGSRGAPRIQ